MPFLSTTVMPPKKECDTPAGSAKPDHRLIPKEVGLEVQAQMQKGAEPDRGHKFNDVANHQTQGEIGEAPSHTTSCQCLRRKQPSHR